MAALLEGHMTDLCLLQGARAAGQTHPPSLSTHHSGCLLPFILRRSFFFSFYFYEELQHQDADVDPTFWRLPSLTMSFLCCFFLRDYGSKRKSGKPPSFFLYLLLC